MADDEEAGTDSASTQERTGSVDPPPAGSVDRVARYVREELDQEAQDVTKASISQALGTMLFPITREVARWEESKIEALKRRARLKRQERLAAATAEDLASIRSQVESDEVKLPMVEQLFRAFEEAGEQPLEDDSVLALWQSLIARIRTGDPDVPLVQEKLASLTPAEAHLMLEIGGGKRARYGINPVVHALSLARAAPYYRNQREAELAISLSKKGLIEQRPPVLQMAAATFSFLAIWAATSSVAGAVLEPFGPAIVPGLVFVVLIGMVLSVAAFPPPIRPTWLGAKLIQAATDVATKHET